MRPGKFYEVVHRTFRNTFGGTDEPVSAEASRSKVMSHECLPKYTSDKCKQIDTIAGSPKLPVSFQRSKLTYLMAAKGLNGTRPVSRVESIELKRSVDMIRSVTSQKNVQCIMTFRGSFELRSNII